MSKPAARASANARPRPIGAVQARQPPQLVVAEGLDTEAEAIDAGLAVRGQALGRDRLRIGLERDLGVGRQRRSAARHASMSRAISAGSRSDGVPPPK